MPTKLTIILEQEKGQPVNHGAMRTAMTMLGSLADAEPQKLALTIACEDADAADLKDELRAIFQRRPAGLRVATKTASEEEIIVEEFIPVLPMDAVWTMPDMVRR